MMKHSYILMIIAIFIIMPIALADECTQEYLFDNAKLYYKFEEAAKPFYDAVGTFDLQYGYNSVRETGKIDYGSNKTLQPAWAVNSTFLQDTSFTLCTWYYHNMITVNNMRGIASYGKYTSVSNADGWQMYISRNGDSTTPRRNKVRLEFDFNATNEYIYSSLSIDSLATWYFICGGWNASSGNAFLCVNGNCGKTVTSTGLTALKYHRPQQFTVGDTIISSGLAGYDARGTVDEMSYYDVPLNKTCMNYLYDAGTPAQDQQYPFGQSFPLSVYYPNSTRHYNFYNGSIVLNSSTTVSCTSNATNWTLQNSQPATTLHFLNPTMLSEKVYSIKFNCTDSVTTLTRDLVVNITIDRTYPTMTVIYPVNNSFINKNFTLLIHYYDFYLYKTTTKIVRRTGNVKVWESNFTAPSGTTQWNNVSKAIIISNGSYPDGVYTVFMRAADTHTKADFLENAVVSKTTQENKDSKTEITTEYLTTRDGEFIEIKKDDEKIKASLDRDSVEKTTVMQLDDATFKLTYPAKMDIEPIKTGDRYVFDHNSRDIYGETYEIIEAEKIVPLYDSPYVGHLIINDKYWFDAVGLEKAKVSKISDNKYVVQWEKWDDSIISQSLGGLNENNKTLNFTIDQTKPTLLNNVTRSFGNGAKIYLNVSEAVSYNATIMQTSCTGTKRKFISNVSFSDQVFIRIMGLNLSTTYYAKVQLHDIANNNRTYCLNFTTAPYAFYISDYEIWRSGSILHLNASVVNSYDRPFVFNYSAFQNGLLILNGRTNWLNLTGIRYVGKWTTIGYNYANITGAHPECIMNDRITFRWRLTNTGNKSVSLKCNDGTQWRKIMIAPFAYYRLYDEYLITYFDNSTKINSSALNYSSSGSWSNLSDIFDNNPDTYGFCQAGFDDCYLTLTYEVERQSLRWPDIYYSVFNLTNVSSGKYYVIINTWDGYNQTQTLNLTYNITFIANLYNEMTGKIIDNVTSNLTFISDDPTFKQTLQFTTSNGIVNIQGLAYVDYSIIFEAPSYEKRHFYMTRDELQLNGSLDLFLLDQGIGDFAIIQVVDQDLNPIEGALVKVLKNVPNFDNKQVISVLRQNFEGESTLDFKLYTDNYQFLVYLDGVLIKMSEETQVSKQVVKIQVPISETKFQSMRYYTNAFVDVTIANGTTSDKRCTFVFAGNDLNYGCLRVSRRNMAQNDVQMCNSCVYGHSGIATCDFNITENNVYFCQGFIDTNTTASEYLGDQETVSLNAGRNVYYTLGLFISFLLTLGMAFAFRDHPSMQIFALALGLIFSVMMGFVAIPYGGLMLILLVAAFFMFKGESL
jgi:hypothetical protein